MTDELDEHAGVLRYNYDNNSAYQKAHFVHMLVCKFLSCKYKITYFWNNKKDVLQNTKRMPEALVLLWI